MSGADTTQSSNEPSKELFLLALDGGGVRGLSSLMILKSIMDRINPANPPKPCDCFDLIGGTSTGGLIAIMLGRLRMSVNEAIEAYRALSEPVFTHQRHRFSFKGGLQGRFDDKALEDGIKQILRDRGLSEETLLKDVESSSCKTFVCATGQYHSQTVVFSSYLSRRRGSDMLDEARIWQTGRATSAATTFFSPIEISGERFVDGATGANNPIPTLMTEAGDIWMEENSQTRLEDNIRCLISIGTGKPGLTKYDDSGILGMMQTLVDISTECERAAEDFCRHYPKMVRENRFFRFNVDSGLENIGLEEWKRWGDIKAATRNHIQLEAVRLRMDKCSEVLRERESIDDCLRSLRRLFEDNRLSLTEGVPAQPSTSSHWMTYTNKYDAWRYSNQQKTALYCCINRQMSHTELRRMNVLSEECEILRAIRDPASSEPDAIATKSVQSVLYSSAHMPDGYELSDIDSLSPTASAALWNLVCQLIFHDADESGRLLRLIRGTASSANRSGRTERGPWATIHECLRRHNFGGRKFVAVISGCDLFTLNDFAFFKTTCLAIDCVSRILFLGSDVYGREACQKANLAMVSWDTERQECLESLFFDGVHTRRDQVAAAVGNTTRWITSHRTYLQWLREDASILWIQGKPGSGKSVLAKKIVNEAARYQNSDTTGLRSIVADWFYSVRGGKKGVSHLSMLRSILYETLKQDPAVYESFKRIYRRARTYPPSAWDWNVEDLCQLFEKVVCFQDGAPILVILDGIDESRDGESAAEQGPQIMDLLRKLVSLQDSHIKIVALSRPHPWIEKKLKKCHVITMQEENRGDIDEIISLQLDVLRHQVVGDDSSDEEGSQISTHSRTSGSSKRRKVEELRSNLPSSGSRIGLESLLAEIRQSLLQRAHGVILWVILVLGELLKLAKPGWKTQDMRQKLYDLPSELDELYGRIIDDIMQEHADDVASLELGSRILTWVIGASDLRPLKLYELLEAIAIPDDLSEALQSTEDPILDRRYHYTAWAKFRQHIYELCGPFIEIQRATNPGPASQHTADFHFKNTHEKDIVLLLHQTARDFLARSSVAKVLYVDPVTAKSFVEAAVLRYIDIVFPPHPTPWAAAAYMLFPRPRYSEGVQKAADYLNERYLLKYCKEALPYLETNERRDLASYLVQAQFQAETISRLLTFEVSENKFWERSFAISKDLKEVSRAWHALKEYLARRPQALMIAREFLQDYVNAGLSQSRSLYWRQIGKRATQLAWAKWFTPSGMYDVAEYFAEQSQLGSIVRETPTEKSPRLLSARERPQNTDTEDFQYNVNVKSFSHSMFLLTNLRDYTLGYSLDPKFVSIHKLGNPVTLGYCSKKIEDRRLAIVCESRIDKESFAHIEDVFREQRSAVLRPTWSREGEPYLAFAGSVEVDDEAKKHQISSLLHDSWWPRVYERQPLSADEEGDYRLPNLLLSIGDMYDAFMLGIRIHRVFCRLRRQPDDRNKAVKAAWHYLQHLSRPQGQHGPEETGLGPDLSSKLHDVVQQLVRRGRRERIRSHSMERDSP